MYVDSQCTYMREWLNVLLTQQTTASQTHFGFINKISEGHSFWDVNVTERNFVVSIRSRVEVLSWFVKISSKKFWMCKILWILFFKKIPWNQRIR